MRFSLAPGKLRRTANRIRRRASLRSTATYKRRAFSRDLKPTRANLNGCRDFAE
jgi:hypothetical protein